MDFKLQTSRAIGAFHISQAQALFNAMELDQLSDEAVERACQQVQYLGHDLSHSSCVCFAKCVFFKKVHQYL